MRSCIYAFEVSRSGSRCWSICSLNRLHCLTMNAVWFVFLCDLRDLRGNSVFVALATRMGRSPLRVSLSRRCATRPLRFSAISASLRWEHPAKFLRRASSSKSENCRSRLNQAPIKAQKFGRNRRKYLPRMEMIYSEGARFAAICFDAEKSNGKNLTQRRKDSQRRVAKRRERS